ncbi:MAG: acyl-CoA dehydrogenase family protein [Spirochaetales bacterium]|nr:acyl-CoA dehydrogenase family protein [Spirochaetales bacterium]
MIDFSLSGKQLEVRNKFRRFSDEYIIPVRLKHDREGTSPHEIISRAWDEGILNGPLPAEYGGNGYSFIESALGSEELGAGCTGMGIIIDTHTLAFLPILLAGSEAQKSLFLKNITERRLLGAFCLTEPDAGSDIGGIKTTAVKRGNSYIINGHKRFITNGETAGFHLVFASTSPEMGNKGMSAFYVPTESPGVSIKSRMDKMGQRAAVQNEIIYSGVEVPSDNLIGAEGMGFSIAMDTFNHTRVSIAALALGNARAAWEYSSSWARNRIQFGKPITTHQGISFKLAEMRTEIEASRMLIWNAASAVDRGADNQAMLSSMAKYYATDKGMRITEEAVQVMGGEGYSKEHPVEKMMRDAKLCQIYEGTNEIQKIIISKNMF